MLGPEGSVQAIKYGGMGSGEWNLSYHARCFYGRGESQYLISGERELQDVSCRKVMDADVRTTIIVLAQRDGTVVNESGKVVSDTL